ncbi:MAG: Methylcrotonyl-CoA carboxylase biotin-containingsubunit [Gammaproteobacteria bacterium]|nr:Methylcrotonyl-CoA carboxylase biotin-containingsubunit [Gammaproteobacteria bacterium]
MIFRRLLIANRGEIAVRIIRTCRRLGIECVLAASEADLESTAAKLADRTICIGPSRSSESYLNIAAVVNAAVSARADAVHPGYGFLSENAALARRCREARLVFIGPTEDQLEAIGDKLKARRHALDAGLPVVPGGAIASPEEALARADRIGWPVLIKAVGGGGGRGMKQVHHSSQLAEALELAMAEANTAFGDARLYLERFVASGRHVEVQLLGDGEHIIHLGTRDCSIQRRYQKLLEEAPAPGLPDGLRAAIHQAAVAFGKHLRYRGAGTVEFLVDRMRNEFYFLEMNARIQVEHPVTEEVTGLDIVAEQIAVAQGQPLQLRQQDVAIQGHCVECRINAEDSARDFRPSPGTVTSAIFPAGTDVRVDTHIESGSRVPPFYDSLLAKIIVSGADRREALRNMAAALANCRIEGVHTNLDVHAALMADPTFARGGVDTSFLADFLQGGAHG